MLVRDVPFAPLVKGLHLESFGHLRLGRVRLDGGSAIGTKDNERETFKPHRLCPGGS